MSASRKLYVALAEGFKRAKPNYPSENAMGVWVHTVTNSARVLKADNSGFDREKFLRASGFTDGDLAVYSDSI